DQEEAHRGGKPVAVAPAQPEGEREARGGDEEGPAEVVEGSRHAALRSRPGARPGGGWGRHRFPAGTGQGRPARKPPPPGRFGGRPCPRGNGPACPDKSPEMSPPRRIGA